MIISHSRRFIFVHIHKAGGTSVERALDPHLAWNDLILGGSDFGERIQGPYQQRFGLNKHSTISEIEAVCGRCYLDEYYVFALVRHPVARICSLYNYLAMMLERVARRHKMSLADLSQQTTTPAMRKQSPALKWASSRAFLTTSGFSDFIRHKDVLTAPGFRSQVDSLLRGGRQEMGGRYFRLENYPDWSEELGAKLGLDFVLPRTVITESKLVEPETMSTDDRRIIQEWYREDIERLGYGDDAVGSRHS